MTDPLTSALGKWSRRGRRGPVELTEAETRAVIADVVERTPWRCREQVHWPAQHRRRATPA
jgi:hypothetical protein